MSVLKTLEMFDTFMLNISIDMSDLKSPDVKTTKALSNEAFKVKSMEGTVKFEEDKE